MTTCTTHHARPNRVATDRAEAWIDTHQARPGQVGIIPPRLRPTALLLCQLSVSQQAGNVPYIGAVQ